MKIATELSSGTRQAGEGNGVSGRLVFRIGMSLNEIDREITVNVEAAIAAADASVSQGHAHRRLCELKHVLSLHNAQTELRSFGT